MGAPAGSPPRSSSARPPRTRPSCKPPAQLQQQGHAGQRMQRCPRHSPTSCGGAVGGPLPWAAAALPLSARALPPLCRQAAAATSSSSISSNCRPARWQQQQQASAAAAAMRAPTHTLQQRSWSPCPLARSEVRGRGCTLLHTCTSCMPPVEQVRGVWTAAAAGPELPPTCALHAHSPVRLVLWLVPAPGRSSSSNMQQLQRSPPFSPTRRAGRQEAGAPLRVGWEAGRCRG